MFVVTVAIVFFLDLTSSVALTIATVTTNIRQYYTTDPQTDGILVFVQDEGKTTRGI
jgi:hypothetical protein